MSKFKKVRIIIYITIFCSLTYKYMMDASQYNYNGTARLIFVFNKMFPMMLLFTPIMLIIVLLAFLAKGNKE